MRWAAAAVRHRCLTLAVWVVLTLILAVQGLSFGERITPSSLDVPGTSSARAQAVADRYFGTEASIPVVLEGPRAELDEQGPELATALRANGGLRVLSPWDGGRLVPELRPRGGAALVLVAGQTRNTFASGIGKDVRTVVRARVQSPVRASMSGFSVIGGELKDASLSAAHDAERLAIPLLALILLLVFRSPIAALVPAIFGIAAVESGYGAVGLLGELRPISDVATALTSMMGLALGVDYSLLLVSRFREELSRGLAPVDAATAAQRTAGRTVLFAGVTLLVAMLAAILLTPGDFLFSAAASVATVAIISMAGAFLAVPALLALLGTNLDRWRIGQAPREGGRWAALAEGVQRRPLLWGGAALAPLVALSLPALTLDTGPLDARALPASSVARAEAQRVASTMGPGWAAPFEVYIATRSGPVTTEARLHAMARWQADIARWPEVAAVIGPGDTTTGQPAPLRDKRRRTGGGVDDPRAKFAVSHESGGQAARITVVPTTGPNDAPTRQLDERLNADMDDLSRATDARAGTAGIAAHLTDHQETLGGRLPWLIAALSGVTFLVLVVLLRAIVLPLISVALNLLTVGASFGAVALCFDGDPPLLGGPGWADTLSLLGTFTIVFALSLDYQVFILTRIRESWLSHRQLRPAITHAIDRTGRVVTGAAAIMGGVFVAFSAAELTTIKQTGVGLATAVLIDATLVRLILLPAATSLVGPATFWLPKWLDRLLPEFNLDGPTKAGTSPT